MKNTTCKGCLTYDREIPTRCPVISSNREDECPCPICLIKMMCELSCEKMNTLNNLIYDKIRDM
jgi:hypothetical protein